MGALYYRDSKGSLVPLATESGSGDTIDLTGAQVGQTIVVKAVDENGKPTEWEAVDMPESPEQIQADYDQNDSAQPDYIKNRPFYTDGEEDYLVDPMELLFVAGESYPDNPIVVSTEDFAVGSVLYVVWDGTVYERTVKYHNMAMYNYIKEDGDLFGIYDYNGTGELTVMNSDSSYSGTVPFALAKSVAKKRAD